MKQFLGIDLGTSGIKLLLIDENEQIVATSSAPLEVSRPSDGWSEQSPNSWISGCETALAELANVTDFSSLAGIGLSGQMHGATLLGQDDQPLRDCILWNDTRSHLEAAALDADPMFRSLTGNIVFPGFTAPKIAWVEKQEPKVFDATRKVLLPKDFLRLWLTGEHVSEMSDASGTSWLDVGKRRWDNDLLAKTNLDLSHMPNLVEGNEISGTLRPDLAEKFGMPSNIPIAGGAGDNAASAVGLGALTTQQAYISLGTSGVVFVPTNEFLPSPDLALHSFCHAVPNRWHQMGVILSATDSLNWFAQLVGSDAGTLLAPLDSTDLLAPGPELFLPYLGGERTPHNDSQIRGSFLGLNHSSDPTAVAKSVLEGVSFALNDSLQAMKLTGISLDQLMVIGGGSRSNYWLRLLATITGCQINLPVAGDFGAAFGAARLGLLAATGAEEADFATPRIERQFEPDPRLANAYSEAYEKFHTGYPATKGF